MVETTHFCLPNSFILLLFYFQCLCVFKSTLFTLSLFPILVLSITFKVSEVVYHLELFDYLDFDACFRLDWVATEVDFCQPVLHQVANE